MNDKLNIKCKSSPVRLLLRNCEGLCELRDQSNLLMLAIILVLAGTQLNVRTYRISKNKVINEFFTSISIDHWQGEWLTKGRN